MDLDTFCAQIVPPEHPEPTTYPGAWPLVELASRLLDLANSCSMEPPHAPGGALLLEKWSTTPRSKAGLSVRWHGRLVLLASETEAWAYTPGEWEPALRQAETVLSTATASFPVSAPGRAGRGLPYDKALLVAESHAQFLARLTAVPEGREG